MASGAKTLSVLLLMTLISSSVHILGIEAAEIDGQRLTSDGSTQAIYIDPGSETTVEFANGFETGDFSAWTGTSTSTGETITVVDSIGLQGSYSARFTSDADSDIENAHAYKDINSEEVYIRGYLYIADGLPLSDEEDRFYLIRLSGSSQNLVYAGVRRIDGVDRWTVYTRDGSSWAGWTDATTLIPAEDTWYRVELHWKMSPTDGVVELFIDGTKVIEVSGVDTSYYGSASEVDFGLPYARGLDSSLIVYGDSFKLSSYTEHEPEPDPPAYDFVVALDGSGDFSDIQSAIDAVPDDADRDYLILVKNGVYTINHNVGLVIKSYVTLIGESRDGVIVQGTGIRNKDLLRTETSTVNVKIMDMTFDQKADPDNLGSSCIYFRTGSHVNPTFQRLTVRNAWGAGIEVPNYQNMLVEDCLIENVQSGINLVGGVGATVRNNIITNTRGNGIFPQANPTAGCVDTVIEYNYIESAGDVAVDISSYNTKPPHQDVVLEHNTIINGHVRMTYVQNVRMRYNTMIGTNPLIVDNGQGEPSNILIEYNNLTIDGATGISLKGSRDVTVRNNRIRMEGSYDVQRGIIAASRGTNLIEGNLIEESSKYGIDFGGWGLGGDIDSLIIRRNTIKNIAEIGIYDSEKAQNNVLIEENTFINENGVTLYGIKTGYTENIWTIRLNEFLGIQTPIDAPSSVIE